MLTFALTRNGKPLDLSLTVKQQIGFILDSICDKCTLLDCVGLFDFIDCSLFMVYVYNTCLIRPEKKSFLNMAHSFYIRTSKFGPEAICS